MEASVKIGRVWNIQIGLHTSWFLIFGLVTWSLATGYFPLEYPLMSPYVHWLLGLVTSLLFFGSVLAHELGHSFVALRNNIGVTSILLFIFGGVAQIERDPNSPGAEFRIAIAGPLVSLGLAGLFAGAWLLFEPISWLAAPSLYLVRINIILAAFNLIPGFPLDGGRVLRSLVWAWTNSYRRATRIASTTGQWVAYGLIAFGVFAIFRGQLFNGLWLGVIGWFLHSAASDANAQVGIREVLQGVSVGQVMERNCVPVPGVTSLTQVVENQVLAEGLQCFFVADNGPLQGVLTLRDISAIPKSKWDLTPVSKAMASLENMVSVDPELDLFSALQIMDNSRVGQVPVLEHGRLMGILTRERVLHHIKTQAELDI
jgi:Zn-dependent protease/CBS domain-containing protein